MALNDHYCTYETYFMSTQSWSTDYFCYSNQSSSNNHFNVENVKIALFNDIPHSLLTPVSLNFLEGSNDCETAHDIGQCLQDKKVCHILALPLKLLSSIVRIPIVVQSVYIKLLDLFQVDALGMFR